MPKVSHCCFLLLLTFLLSPICFAASWENQAHGPISVRSQNPAFLLFHIDPLENAQTLPKGRFSFSADTNYSNLFERKVRATGTGLYFDMELVRQNFGIRYGLTRNQTLGIEVPISVGFTGILDEFIQSFHDAFGLPNAGRQNVPNEQFSFVITQNGADLYRVNDLGGLGDIVIFHKMRLASEGKYMPALAVKTSFKTPTGRPSRGTGSGKPDGAISLFAEKGIGKFDFYSQVGVSILGKNEDFGSIQRNALVVFGQAVEWEWFRKNSLIVQFWGNTSAFESGVIGDLSDTTLDLTVGTAGHIPLTQKPQLNKFPSILTYHLGFSEDITSYGPSIDFTVFLKLGLVAF